MESDSQSTQLDHLAWPRLWIWSYDRPLRDSILRWFPYQLFNIFTNERQVRKKSSFPNWWNSLDRDIFGDAVVQISKCTVLFNLQFGLVTTSQDNDSVYPHDGIPSRSWITNLRLLHVYRRSHLLLLPTLFRLHIQWFELHVSHLFRTERCRTHPFLHLKDARIP